MNRHDDYIQELLSAYLDGETTADEQAHAEQLLQRSDECRQMLEQLRSISKNLQALPQQQLPHDFPQRVLTEAQRAQEQARAPAAKIQRAAARGGAYPTPKRRPWLPLGVAATIAATLLLATISFWTFSTEVRQTADQRIASDEPPREAANGERAEQQVEQREQDPSSGSPMPGAESVPQPDRFESSDRSPLAVQAPPVTESPQVGVTPPQPAEGAAEEAVEEPLDFKLLFLVRVSITSRGLLDQSFEQALAKQHIRFEEPIGMDAELKRLLLENRFIADDKVRQDDKEGGVSLVYVEADAWQIDAATQGLRTQYEVRDVSFDLTLKPAHAQLLEHLHQRGAGDKMGKEERRKPPAADGLARSIAGSAEFHERSGGDHVLLSVFSPGAEWEDASGITVRPISPEQGFTEIAPRPSTETPASGDVLNPRVRALFLLRIVGD